MLELKAVGIFNFRLLLKLYKNYADLQFRPLYLIVFLLYEININEMNLRGEICSKLSISIGTCPLIMIS